MHESVRRLGLAAMVLGASVWTAAPLLAQVVYAPRMLPFGSYTAPYDESYDTQPSYKLFPAPYGYPPTVRVVRRCAYLGGWNVGDFSRNVNGIPLGVDHTCQPESRLRARY